MKTVRHTRTWQLQGESSQVAPAYPNDDEQLRRPSDFLGAACACYLQRLLASSLPRSSSLALSDTWRHTLGLVWSSRPVFVSCDSIKEPKKHGVSTHQLHRLPASSLAISSRVPRSVRSPHTDRYAHSTAELWSRSAGQDFHLPTLSILRLHSCHDIRHSGPCGEDFRCGQSDPVVHQPVVGNSM